MKTLSIVYKKRIKRFLLLKNERKMRRPRQRRKNGGQVILYEAHYGKASTSSVQYYNWDNNMPSTKVEEITTSSVTIFQTLKEVLTYDLSRRKEPRSDKMNNILSTNLEKLVNEVLEALPPETTSVAVAHNKYWTNT